MPGNRASKAQYILPWRSYCPGHSRQRSGSAGAWTVPPGGSRFHQLALPNEGRARRRGGFEDGDREGKESAGAGSYAAGF